MSKKSLLFSLVFFILFVVLGISLIIFAAGHLRHGIGDGYYLFIGILGLCVLPGGIKGIHDVTKALVFSRSVSGNQ